MHAAEVVVEAVKVHVIQIVDHFVLISVLELPIRSKFLQIKMKKRNFKRV